MKLVLHVHFTLLLLVTCAGIHGEEDAGFCDKGDEGCVEDEERHNVWTERRGNSIAADDIIVEYLKENGVSLSRLELALLLSHLDVENDGRVDKHDLEALQNLEGEAIKIVQSVVASFDRLDQNDDGKLTKDELPASSSESEGEDDEDAGDITISQYLKVISKLDKTVSEALSPFQGLDFLSPFEVKTVIGKSVAVFLEKDVDGSGGLNLAEYLSQIDRPDNPRSKILDDTQKETIFTMIDKDGDGEISFSEFQAVIPKGPPTMPTSKDMDSIFDDADQDGDGFWSKDEFAHHLKNMVIKTGAPEPNENDISAAFRQLDVDKDGLVSKKEMHGIQKQIQNIQEDKAVQGFNEMDTDGDGVLTKDEMVTMAEFMEERSGQKVDVDMLIKMLDKNGNDVIELDELKEMVQRMVPK
ncbi:calcium-binding protein LPS1-beta [Folsomia candida]|nr:calcium-binding protein LPS1-beta [Folsomia candida]